MSNQHIADLIASKLRDGIVHPGDPAKGVKPRAIALPFGMRAGQPQEMLDLMDATTTMLAEAVVHLIETDGDTALVPRDELEVLHAAAPDKGATVAVHCRCDPKGTPLALLTVTHPDKAVLDGGALIRSLGKRDPACPHKWTESDDG
jgi:hypothetical protein